jgi:glutathione S-transferase
MTTLHYVLYGSPGAASLVVHWMLLELGVPFEYRKLDFDREEQKSAAYLKLNANGTVPTLLVDGKPHAETAALLMLLAERHPEARLAPALNSATRADYLQWMVYLANTLMPAFRAWFYPHEPAGESAIDAVKSAAKERIEAVWNRIDQRLADGGRYMLRDELSAADFLLTMLIRWSRNMPKRAESWPNIARYSAQMRSMPSLKLVHERERLTDWIS